MKKYVKYLLLMVLMVMACERDEEISSTSFSILQSEATPTNVACTIICTSENVDGEVYHLRLLLGSNEELNPTISRRSMQREGDNKWSCRLANLAPSTSYFYGFEVYTSKDSLLLSYRSSFTTSDNQGLFVSTHQVSEILSSTATCGGEVVMTVTQTIQSRGVCWATTPNPTVSHNRTSNGSTTGSFTSQITGLVAGTTYYVRAYAVSDLGTVYGEQRTFTTTLTNVPTVTTDPAINVASTTALCGGNVTSDGGQAVSARGVCWGTSQNPSVEGSHTVNGTGVGEFSSPLSGLNPSTTYYVRAYATNVHGTSYGAQRTFTTTAAVTETTPTVTTAFVTNIGPASATSGGSVTTDGGRAVSARGVCWSTSPNPTIANAHTSDGVGTGTFTSNITGLAAATTYYLRAYATNNIGTAYGEQRTFNTVAPTTPTVATVSTSNVTHNSITATGNVSADGYSTVTTRGICYSTSPSPTITDQIVPSGSGTGFFTATITGLAHSTTYYLRAYATNGQGTAYGQQLVVSTPSIYIEGSIQSLFSVSATQQVMFSQGNLQYQSSTGIWRFALNQYSHEYDYSNGLISSSTSNFFDLFGIGTSGYNNYNPWLSSTTATDYIYNVNIAGTHYDWGVHNAISNGGSQAGLWRCLSESEWSYLLNTRTGAISKRGLATIFDVPGMVLLPDNWTLPAGCTFNASFEDYTVNEYDTDEWALMEQAGAVFLPAAGLRDGTTCAHRSDDSEIYGGYYWTTTPVMDFTLYKYLYFGVSGGLGLYNYGTYKGLSVRLVHDHTP